jgi:hypothetical protein
MSDSVSYAMDQFFGCYFHQDWDLEAADWPQIVDNFVVDVQPNRLESLARDIDEFRSRGTDDELHAALLNMGGFYDPRPDTTYKSWLGEVASRLRQHAAAAENSDPPA